MNEVNSRVRHRTDREIEDGACPACGECPEDPVPHPCPFRAEINDDSVTRCTCCYDCMRECRLEV